MTLSLSASRNHFVDSWPYDCPCETLQCSRDWLQAKARCFCFFSQIKGWGSRLPPLTSRSGLEVSLRWKAFPPLLCYQRFAAVQRCKGCSGEMPCLKGNVSTHLSPLASLSLLSLIHLEANAPASERPTLWSLKRSRVMAQLPDIQRARGERGREKEKHLQRVLGRATHAMFAPDLGRK